jgi:tetratricopeptide (TPR) repeat protein
MRQVGRCFPLLLILAACAAVGAPLAAQDSASPSISLGRKSARHSIRGTLRDAATNRNVSGVKVDLRPLGGVTVATVFTDVSGDFTFDELGSGQYDIAANEPGYEPVNQQVSVQDSVFGLQIWLRKPNGAHGESAGPTISVRELSIPPKAHELMQKGLMQLHAKSDYRGSITQFERAIKEYPAYYEAYAEIGVAYAELGNVARSEQALRKSIDVSQQRYANAYFLLADLYVNAERFADAEPVARKGAALEGNSWKGHYELACALYGLDRDAEAETEAAAAAQLQPDGPETRLLLANIQINLRKYPAVLEDLDAYLKLAPNGAHADQARQLREQVQTALEKAQTASESDEDPAEDDEPDSK